MLRSALKTSPEKCDFSRKIKWQIREHFNEDPNSYMNEVRELEVLRASACHPPQDFSGCALLKRYYSQLHFLQNRFTFDESGRDEVFFTWSDLYTGMAYSTNDIKHEVACILFNIGALHTNLGAMDKRQTADGMKMSCSHFQCAAWAFHQLNENYPQSRETDLCIEVVAFLETISLAQAQECILEKSIFDARKPGNIAKVAAQIVDFYNSALKLLEVGDVIEVTGQKTYKSWMKYTQFKMAFYQCLSLLYMGIHCEELQKMGDRLAYFQCAIDKLNEVTKLAKKMNDTKMDGDINDAVSFTHDVVGGKLEAAEKENEFIYHEKVPDKSSLADIKGASLVKGTPFDINDPEVSGEDIFHRLVPMEAHEASSLYSEEKAKILRRIGTSIEEKDQELALFLTSLQIEQLCVHSEPQSVPQELVDCCAAFSVEGNVIDNLVAAMSKLSSVYTEVEATLNHIKEILSEEEDREKEVEKSQAVKRPRSMILKEVSLEAGRLGEAHVRASESNVLLHKAINSHLANLRTLTLPLGDIQAQLPSLQVVESGKDEACIKELQRLLDKVEEMRKQRVMLYDQLRDAIRADDITKLATRHTDLKILFPQELGKHERLTSLIEQNLSAQSKILAALTEANARYGDTRRWTNDIQSRRAATVAALLSSAHAYPELLSKGNKGLEFYRKLEANVNKLLQRVRSVCLVQQEERSAQSRSSAHPAESADAPAEEERPKLKDFLHLMKKDPLPAGSLPAGSLPVDATYSYPYQRPAPLGAEHSEKQDHFRATSVDTGYPPSGYSTAMANTTGYSSNASGSYTYQSTSQVASFTSGAYSPAQYGYTGYPAKPSSSQQPIDKTVSSGPSTGSQYIYQYAYPASGNPNSGESTPMDKPVQSAPQNSYQYSYPASGNPGPVNPPMDKPAQPVLQYTYQYGYPTSGSPASGNPDKAVQSASQHPYPYGYAGPSSNPVSGSPAPSHSSVASGNPPMDNPVQPASQYSYPYGYAVPSNPVSGHPAPSHTASGDPTSGYQYGYSAAGNPASTNPSSVNPYQYGYAGAANPPMDKMAQSAPQYHHQYGYPAPYGYPSGSNPDVQHATSAYAPASYLNRTGSFQHGMTATTNTAPISGAGSKGPNSPAGTGISFYSEAKAANSYHSYPYDPSSANAPIVTAVPAVPALPALPAVPVPAVPVPAPTTNLELLSLLDQSVPVANTALLVPSSTNGTVTLTTKNSNTTPTELDSGGSVPISSVSESAAPPVAAVSAAAAVDPLSDPEAAAKLVLEVDRFDKLVDGLSRKSLNGPTPLDVKWKEVQDQQDWVAAGSGSGQAAVAKKSISVARCYPMKNRVPDVLPYDHNRIQLPTTKDDYINASRIDQLSLLAADPCYIVTQCPLPCTQQDFWTMVWQQQVEILLCLLSDAEMTKNCVYWPQEKLRDVECGPWLVSLQSTNVRPHCNEKILRLSKHGENQQRMVILLQMTSWPGHSLPTSPQQLIDLVDETLTFWKQQRSTAHPILIHCSAGDGRSGLFCLVAAAITHLLSGGGVVDVVKVAASLCQQRRNMFRDREHLLFGHQAILLYAQQLLIKRGIVSASSAPPLQGSNEGSRNSSLQHSTTDDVSVFDGLTNAASDAQQESIGGVAPPSKKDNNIDAILDPANFSMDPLPATTSKTRVTKDSFIGMKNNRNPQLGAISDPLDPLSQLDPLWSLGTK